MDIYKLKFTRLQNEIFRLLCIRAGTSLSQREMARLLKVSPTAVGKAVKGLAKERAIKIGKTSLNVKLVELDRGNPRAMEMKRAENLKILCESGLVRSLEEKFPGTAIVLFGSYSRGDDTINSDMDIAIIGSGEKHTDLAVFEKLLERTVSLHFYPSLKGISKELKENICNGIVLAGGIEL